MNELRFWFDPASTYSWLSVLRIDAAARDAGVRVRWQPFLLGPIFRAKGWETSPFNLDPAKGAHMWRDLERRAAGLGHPVRRPDAFPANSLRAARVMTAAIDQPWLPAFARAVMTAQFARGANIAEDATLEAALREAAAGPEWLARAEAPAVKDALRAATGEAAAVGIFGAPSFTVGRELFWGDDRLDEALAWARGRHPLQADARLAPEGPND
ncbi:2-hydroxychromene-2-carboxylate isomerase [Limibaculum sp. FT325]|uniref:2-hydroxychromene-2-carboxylate isomerase n=1 Tax=Thermohalobaculum sediminis TaxID=2939436 RepID=UPI0020BDD519|nr:2-hydroxychromene-2-carboxylate isomerase [Limibaculum sediminis]MCL5777001.1 2-hydroxychromene-2-carboxylate isomerase [Limibaculum sediminis]